MNTASLEYLLPLLLTAHNINCLCCVIVTIIFIFYFLGILCGACRDQGVSVLQGECISCSYHHILLVPLLGECC